jgi:regulator of protease activity HflC (stomatin/prohibitin superfamily)
VNPFANAISNLVTKQSVVFDMPVKGCKTLDNITVEIDLSVVFRIMGDEQKGEKPELVRDFVYKVTPKGLETQLRDAGEEAVRSLARSILHTEVYGLRNTAGKVEHVPKSNVNLNSGDDEFVAAELNVVDTQNADGTNVTYESHDEQDAQRARLAASKAQKVTASFLRALNSQFKPQGVEITDVIITDVTLPGHIQQQMESKTYVISEQAQQKMQQQYDLLVLSQNEEIETLKQSHKEERLQEKQHAEKERKEVEVMLNEMKATLQAELNSVRQDAAVEIQQIKADKELQIARLQQEIQEVLTKERSQSQADAQKMLAETRKQELELRASADLEASRNTAKATEVLAAAEGKAAPLLAVARQFELDQMKNKVYGSLAGNSELVVSAESDPNLNTLLLCDSILSEKAGKGNKSQVLAELMVLQRNGQVLLNVGDSLQTPSVLGGKR